MTGDIISDHRERMLNLKKYYPFFRLTDTSFSNFKDGKYEILDMDAVEPVTELLRDRQRIFAGIQHPAGVEAEPDVGAGAAEK